jgi:hypothetical protein
MDVVGNSDVVNSKSNAFTYSWNLGWGDIDRALRSERGEYETIDVAEPESARKENEGS